MQQSSYQVIIAGAGPAGLAAALTLSAYKIPYCLIDANITAVQKSGDAIPPNAKPLLTQLGILHLVQDAKHIPYYGNKSIWGTPQVQEKAFITGLHGHGYLLDRLYFEQQFRNLVQQQSGDFYQGYQLKKAQYKDNSVEVLIQKGAQTIDLKAPYIIDATGRKASVCRHLGAYKQDLDAQMTISFWHQLSKPIPRQIWVEATEYGWWYLAPNANHQVNCMFFTLKELLPQRKDMVLFLQQMLQNSLQIKQIIQPTQEELQAKTIMPSGSSCLAQPFGEHWVAVGDAAFSYDPISSYGITSALATGFYAGHAVAEKLAGEADAFLAYRYVLENGSRAYLQKLQHQYSMEKRWPAAYYWKNRLASQ